MTNNKAKIYYCDVLTEDKKLHKNIVYKEGNAIRSLVKGKTVLLKVLRIVTIHHELNKGATFFKLYDEKQDNKRGFCIWIKKSKK